MTRKRVTVQTLCAKCGGMFNRVKGTNRKYCPPPRPCAQEAVEARLDAVRVRLGEVTCVLCPRRFTKKSSNAKYCSPACREKGLQLAIEAQAKRRAEAIMRCNEREDIAL